MEAPIWMDPPTHGGCWTGVLRPVPPEKDAPLMGRRFMEILPFGGLLLIPAHLDHTRLLTIYNTTLLINDGILIANSTEDTRWFYHEPVHIMHYRRLKEVCAGMGGIAIEPAKQESVQSHMDHNALACAQLKANGADNVIMGSVHENAHVAMLHAAGGSQPAVLLQDSPANPIHGRETDLDSATLAQQPLEPLCMALSSTCHHFGVCSHRPTLQLHHAEPGQPHALPAQDSGIGTPSPVASTQGKMVSHTTTGSSMASTSTSYHHSLALFWLNNQTSNQHIHYLTTYQHARDLSSPSLPMTTTGRLWYAIHKQKASTPYCWMAFQDEDSCLGHPVPLSHAHTALPAA